MAEHKKKENTFATKESKATFQKGLKYLAIALPFLFISPIVIAIGFKALNKSNNFLVLILGCFLAIVTIALVTQAFRVILKALFTK